MATKKPLNDAASEIAAAETALKAAQDKLEAVKAKYAAEDVEEALEPDEVETVEAIIVEELDDEPETAPKIPEVKEAVPTPEAAPTWVPYSTNQTPPVQDVSSATVPPEGAANPAGYQPPTGYGAGYTAQQPPHAGPGAVPPQQPYYGYQQPQYYQQPYGQPVVSPKDHVAAGLLAIFLGWLGIHKFYLGYNTAGFIMLAVTILGSLFTLGLAGLVICVISVIEGILYLTKSQTEFEQIYINNKREWF